MSARPPSWDDLWAEAKRADMVDVAHRLGAKLKHSGADWIGPCPNGCARENGFIVTPSKGIFLCRPSGATGDAIDMVVHVKDCGKPEALEFVTGRRLPSSRELKDAAARKKERANEEAIEAVLKRAKPLAATHAEAYLRGRGIDPQPKLTKDLLFVADLDYWSDDKPEKIATLPAMVALIRNVAGKVIGIHQTYLDPKEPRKWTPPDGLSAKKIRGHAKGGLIRLGHIGDKLAVGEGIETTLRWYMRGVGPEDVSIACGVSLDNIAGSSSSRGQPDTDNPGMILPADVRELILLGDGDSERLMTQGKIATGVRRAMADKLIVNVHFAPDGKDWADEISDETPPIEGGEAFLKRVARYDTDTKHPKFVALRANTLTFASSLEWRIKRLLPRVGVFVFYGPTESFKSFGVMDIFAAIDAGEDWADLKTERCPVVYIQAEAPGSFAKRVAGLQKAKNKQVSDNFLVITVAPNLGTSKGDLPELIAAIEATGVKPGTIAIDTMSASLGGGEENSTGTQLFLANARELSNRFEAAVVAIHHPPRDGANPRGHSSLEGNADGIVRFERADDGGLATTLFVEKLKDEEHNFSLKMRLARIVIGHDEDGDEISTLVVTGIESSVAEARQRERSQRDKSAAAILRDAFLETYDLLAVTPASDTSWKGYPGVRKVKIEAIEAALVEADRVENETCSDLVSGSEQRATRKAKIRLFQARQVLLDKKILKAGKGLIWRAK